MIFIPNFGELEGFCQGILILKHFWGNFLRKIGWFKILGVAVSPACPAIACGEGGSNVEEAKEQPFSIGHLVRIVVVYASILSTSKFALSCLML